MRLFKLACKRETAIPILALTFASACCLALVIGRVLWTGNVRYSFLAWNLFLAWLPLAFALLAQEKFQLSSGRDWRFGALACTWLIFFPNAPYIFTDVIHLTTHFYQHFWVDLVLILSCALTGLVLGFVSLYLMQGVVKRLLGSVASWIFIALVAALTGFGVCLGRFLRFNSWDIVVKPIKVYHGIGLWLTDPFGHPMTFAFPILFGTFMFIAYLMLYALTHLQHAQLIPLSPRPARPVEHCEVISN
jgi:uncharacterized membrane protein